jgi:hypothetical protein
VSFEDRVNHVFRTPASEEQIRAFQEWEAQNAARMRVRYTDFPVASAFGLRPSDVVTVDAKMTFDFTGTDPRLLDESGRYVGTLAGTPVDLLKRFLTALDGERPIAAVCSQPPFAEHAGPLIGLVAALLGGPFLVTAGLDELERQLPAIELLRFPYQSRYAMPREYWENSIAVRRALDSFYARLDDFEAFSNGLRGLHRLATIGASAENYYGGAGGVATVPGEFRTTSIGNRFDERRKRIFNHWLQLLALPYALVESGSILSTNGVPLVRISDRGRECHHPYGRAGEQLASQVNEIRIQLAAAWAVLPTDRSRFLRHCALFHHAFAHAHPFGNINNSIAMNIVNDLLRRAGIGVVPHLYFDQVAYFLQPEDYVRVFERAVEAHVVDGGGRDRPTTKALLEGVASTTRGRSPA